MPFQSLVRRKTQLALLAAACERHEPARVSLRDTVTNESEQFDSHLLALQSDGLLLDWKGRAMPAGRVRVKFGLRGQEFAFEAMARGLLEVPSSGQGRTVVKLGLPLRLQRRDTRRTNRLTLADMPPVIATFHGVLDERLCFEAQVEDISSGGLSVRTDEPRALAAARGTLCWAEFVLPRGGGTFEFVLRLIHTVWRNDGDAIIGWAFQPGDDGSMHERSLARLESYLKREASPVRPCEKGAGGC